MKSLIKCFKNKKKTIIQTHSNLFEEENKINYENSI